MNEPLLVTGTPCDVIVASIWLNFSLHNVLYDYSLNAATMNSNKPRHSLLEMFDPLMVNSGPQTPLREVANASPDNSDKENDLPGSSDGDTLSLTQFFNRVYKVERTAKPATPNGKLIDFGDVTMDNDEDVQLISICLDNRDLLHEDADESAPEDEDQDMENILPCSSMQMFTTPRNRKILADIDIDMPTPPKLSPKQGTLKTSFLRAAIDAKIASDEKEPEPELKESENVSMSDYPMVTLYPPQFESTPAPETSSSQRLEDKHLSPPTTSKIFFHDSPGVPIPRPNLGNQSFDAHRVSVDLQSSFQMQLQSSDFSFDLVNDKISFLGAQEDSILRGMDDSFDINEEERRMDELVKSAAALEIKDEQTVEPESVLSDSGSIGRYISRFVFLVYANCSSETITKDSPPPPAKLKPAVGI